MTDQHGTTSFSESARQDGSTGMQTYRHLTPRALAELHARASLQQESPEHTRKAQQLVEHGHIERLSPDEWEIVGSEGTIYKLVAGRCSCKARRTPDQKFGCYHALGVALYGWVEKALQEEHHPMFVEDEAELGLPLGPTTLEEHLAQKPREVPQDAIGQHAARANVSEDREAGYQLMEALSEPERSRPSSSTPPQRPSDLTPVELPGGGQRTRSIGSLMQALARAQLHMKNPSVDSRGQVGNIKTRFASTPLMRNVIVAALAEEEVAILQYTYQTDRGMRCMTTLGHPTGEYVSVPLDVPLEGRDSLMDRGKTIGFLKRWALQTTVVLFGEDEDEGMEALPSRTQPRADIQTSHRSVPDMTQESAKQKSVADLRHEIEGLAKTQNRQVEYLWQAAEKHFGCGRQDLTTAQLAQMVKGLTDKGAAG